MLNIFENNNWIIPLSIGCAVISILIGLYEFKFKKKKSKEVGDYKAKKFLTDNEKSCLYFLQKEFPDYHICPQVSMGALLEPVLNQNSQNYDERQEATSLRYKVGSKIVDFVFLDKYLEPQFIVELDDKTHDVKQEADYQRDKNLALAGIYTARIRRNGRTLPNRGEILDLIKQEKKKFS